MSKKLPFHFSKLFSADIWEQQLSGQHLLLTLRNSEAMQVKFSLIDLETGDLIFDGISFEEEWWISVYHFHGEVIVFQIHEDTQNIESRTYFALDIQSQEVLWSLDDSLAMGRHQDFIQMRALENDEGFFWVDMRTGETFEERPQEYSKNSTSYAEKIPLHYTEDNPHFQTVSSFLKAKLGVVAIGAIDYLEHQNKVMMAYHTKTEEVLANHLLVMTTNGQMMLHQNLDSGLKGMVSGAFFIVGEQLIFVEGRNRLNSYLTEE